jgi:uncharacterized protein (DUF2062 family)
VRPIARAAQILRQIEGEPTRVAAAFGIGIFLAFFPILGIHTAIALGVAILFRLSKVAILLGAWVNNPWTIAPLYGAGTFVGCILLGVKPIDAAAVDWSLSGRAFYEGLRATLAPLLWPFVLGNLVLGAVAGLVAFVVLRAVLSRRARAEAAPTPASPR